MKKASKKAFSDPQPFQLTLYPAVPGAKGVEVVTVTGTSIEMNSLGADDAEVGVLQVMNGGVCVYAVSFCRVVECAATASIISRETPVVETKRPPWMKVV